MKKLIMMAAVTVAAVVANAASVSWSASGFLFDGAESPAKVTSQPSAYLMFVTADYTQSDLLNAFTAAKGDTSATLASMTSSGAMATGTGAILASSKLPTITSEYAMTSDMNAYAVIFVDGKMFISNVADALYDSVTGEATVSLGSLSAISKTTFDAAAGSQGAGWYAAVPEPTSGLLILLGVAGLALKRKRA